MNKEPLQQWRKEYEQLHMSDTARHRIMQRARRRTPRQMFSRIASTAAVCVLLFAGLTFGAVNVSPALAQNLASNPALAPLVNIITFHRFQLSEGNMTLDVQTPHITGLSDPALEKALNEEFDTLASTVIHAFQADLQDLRDHAPELDPHMSMTFGYTVLTNTPSHLSLDIYQINSAGSAGAWHHYYTVDKNTQQLVTLSSLFREGADYITPISSYIRQEIQRRLEKEPSSYWQEEDHIPAFSSIRADQPFYIDTSGRLVICFEQYEIGPGSTGSPTFTIPSSVTAPLQ